VRCLRLHPRPQNPPRCQVSGAVDTAAALAWLAEIQKQRTADLATVGQTHRATYGGTPGTVRILAPLYTGGPVRHWFTHDIDPGFGPMAYEAGAGIVLLEQIAP
jgi:hypothetical protein